MRVVTETFTVITLTMDETLNLAYQIEAIGADIDTPVGQLGNTLADLDLNT